MCASKIGSGSAEASAGQASRNSQESILGFIGLLVRQAHPPKRLAA
jgi:hypothetical protein